MIQLQRNVQVRTFETEATVAVGRYRPEFLAVARLAADFGHEIGGGDISRELLGNLPEHVGWRVLDRAIDLGLLERQGHRGPASLSASGRTMLDQGVVLVPEEGVWRFHVVEDPLVPATLVHVQRLSVDDAWKERDHLYKRPRGSRPQQGSQTPRILGTQVNTLLRSVHDNSGFEVRDLSDRGEEGPSGTLQLSLCWEPGCSPSVAIRGALPCDDDARQAPAADAKLPTADALSEFTYEDIWVTLVARFADTDPRDLREWANRAGVSVLPTTMERWPRAARHRFLTDIDVPPSEVAHLGRFDSTKLTAVPLVAASDAAAREWAEWLLWDGIEAYVVPSDIDTMRRTVAAKFPLHEPELPIVDELLARARSSPRERTSRYLLTPADLGLWS